MECDALPSSSRGSERVRFHSLPEDSFEHSPGAGYGLVARKSEILPQTPLFTIPANAMLNIATLSPHYPRSRSLTATQLISLHLLLYRPSGSEDSPDPLFGPYISLLPRDFDYHPLTWLCHKEVDHPGYRLLSRLPPSVMHSLLAVADRLQADWNAVCQYLVCTYLSEDATMLKTAAFQRNNPSILAMAGRTLPNTVLEYSWAWLNGPPSSC